MLRDELIGGSVGTGLSAIGTALQSNEVLQTISLIITILGGLITFIIMPLINWYKSAKKDGKIDSKEIKEGIEIVNTGIEKIHEGIDDKKEGK